jgi:predicted ArsR family transcriptional regulator
VYTLTDASAVHFPQRYDQLMVELLDELKATVGPRDAQELLYRIIEHRLENMPRVDLAWPLEQRLEHLTEYLTRQGHISSWERRDGRWYLYSSNCPYLHVAAEHPELCAMDTFLIRRLIGAQVVNLQHITDGSHMCIYRIDG